MEVEILPPTAPSGIAQDVLVLRDTAGCRSVPSKDLGLMSSCVGSGDGTNCWQPRNALRSQEFLHDDGGDDVCIVGYALNAKKLRKSGVAAGHFDSVSTTKDSHTTTEHDKSTGRNKTVNKNEVWRGGGLADILFQHDRNGQPVVDGVKFCAWDFDKQATEQVRKIRSFVISFEGS
jgi:hypothetical protein